MERTFAEQTLARAIAVLGDVRAEDDDREDGALVIGTILWRACPTEADLAGLISALGRALHVDLAIRRVLGAIQKMRPPAVVERAGRGVELLMDRAHRDGDNEALAELLLVTFEEPKWHKIVRDEWGKSAVVWAVNELPETKYPVVLLISGWIHAYGRVPAWLGEFAEDHPDLVTSSSFPKEIRWRIHSAAPSVRGWRSLASALGWNPLIEPALFSDQAGVAVTTLKVAIGETVHEAVTFRLRLWLHELTGQTNP